MTRIVSSKAEFKAAIAEANEIGMRLAFVIVKALGVFEVWFKPAETFADWSKASHPAAPKAMRRYASSAEFERARNGNWEVSS